MVEILREKLGHFNGVLIPHLNKREVLHVRLIFPVLTESPPSMRRHNLKRLSEVLPAKSIEVLQRSREDFR